MNLLRGNSTGWPGDWLRPPIMSLDRWIAIDRPECLASVADPGTPMAASRREHRHERHPHHPLPVRGLWQAHGWPATSRWQAHRRRHILVSATARWRRRSAMPRQHQGGRTGGRREEENVRCQKHVRKDNPQPAQATPGTGSPAPSAPRCAGRGDRRRTTGSSPGATSGECPCHVASR